METKYWITVEDSTFAYTSSLMTGQFMTRFVDVGVIATSKENAQNMAKKIVSEVHRTDIELLSIA